MDLVGEVLGNRYEILKKIGVGGMATVYKARCRILNRFVAIKVLKEEYAQDQEFIKRFQIEAQSAASLSHPNIVSIYDVANDGEIHYIVMELIEGKTLKEIINENGKLEWRDATKIASQIASGLATAHKNHIIHRDIKPHNIIMTKEGIAKITDFGIAKASTSGTINVKSSMGSVHYFSPEHARGGYTDEKSDIYSLGVVLYEMVTGVLPFDSDTPISVAMKHLKEDAVPPIEINPNIPQGLSDIIMKALQKDAINRYQTATSMYNDLQKVLKAPDSSDVGIVMDDDDEFATKQIPVINTRTISKIDTNKTVKPRGTANMKKEEEEDDTSSRTKKLLIMLALLLVFFGIAFAIGNWAYVYLFGPSEQVIVPNVVGYSEEVARERLGRVGLALEVEAKVQNDEVLNGYVISQSRVSGDKIEKGSKVGVTISLGRMNKVPDVLTVSLNGAEMLIKSEGFVFEKVEEFSDEVEEGKIIRQEPKADTMANVGETIKVFVSKGPAKKVVEVPDVKPLSQSEAKQQLEELGLVVNINTVSSFTYENGKILNQDIEPGQKVEEGTEITLVVNIIKMTSGDEEDNGDNGEIYDPTKPEDKPEEKPDNKQDNKPDNNQGGNKPSTPEPATSRRIALDLSNEGARDTFTLKVVLEGDVTGTKILHDATHSRSDGKIYINVPDNVSGLLRVSIYIDGEVKYQGLLEDFI